MAFKLAELFVDIGANMAPIQAALKKTQSSLTKIASTPIQLSGASKLAIGAGLAATTYAITKAVSGASDLYETLSKTGVVFGDSAKIATDAADDMAKKFGVPKREMLDTVSAFGLVAKATGQSQKEAADFSVTLSKLAMDAASFYNVPIDVALEKIRSGLAGEAEPLRAFGVFLTEDAVKAKALAMGLAESGDKLTEGQKIMARSALIMSGLSDAQGDLERTSGSYANQSRELWGRLQNLADQVGTALLPAFTELITIVNDSLEALSHYEGMTATFNGFVNSVKNGIQEIGVVYRNWGLITERTGVMIAGHWTNLQEVFAWLGESAKAVANFFVQDWQKAILMSFDAVATALVNLGKNFMDFFTAVWETASSWGEKPFEFKMTPILEGFNNEAFGLKMPELKLSSVEDQLKEIDNKMVAVEKKHADAVAAVGGAAGGGSVKKADDPIQQMKKKDEAAKAEFVGIEDFAKRIQSGALDKDRIAKDHLAIAKDGLELQKKIVKNTEKPHLAVAK